MIRQLQKLNARKKESGVVAALCHWVPVITMLKLNVVILPALADAVKVNVAETELPAART
jgi:hypothetical protein